MLSLQLKRQAAAIPGQARQNEGETSKAFATADGSAAWDGSGWAVQNLVGCSVVFCVRSSEKLNLNRLEG